jgi:hypothetical protein
VLRISYANVISTVALFIALGGTSVATHEAIFSDDIVNGEVKRPDIANQAVTSSKIHDGTISTQDYKSGSVKKGVLAPAAVTSTRLADNSVSGLKVLDDSLTVADIDEASIPDATEASLIGGDTPPANPTLFGSHEVVTDRAGRIFVLSDAEISFSCVPAASPCGVFVGLYLDGEPIGGTMTHYTWSAGDVARLAFGEFGLSPAVGPGTHTLAFGSIVQTGQVVEPPGVYAPVAKFGSFLVSN